MNFWSRLHRSSSLWEQEKKNKPVQLVLCNNFHCGKNFFFVVELHREIVSISVCVCVWINVFHTNLIPPERNVGWYGRFDILLRALRPFWAPHEDNPTSYGANFALNSHDRFRCIQRSDTSKLFHAWLILLQFCNWFCFGLVWFRMVANRWRWEFCVCIFLWMKWNKTRKIEKNNINSFSVCILLFFLVFVSLYWVLIVFRGKWWTECFFC